MKKLHLLTTAAVLLVSLSGSSFAATRTHHTRAEQSTAQPVYPADPMYSYGSGGYSYGSGDDEGRGNGNYWYGPRQNQPYPDRPWGDPDRD
jgi:hypothetical protein